VRRLLNSSKRRCDLVVTCSSPSGTRRVTWEMAIGAKGGNEHPSISIEAHCCSVPTSRLMLFAPLHLSRDKRVRLALSQSERRGADPPLVRGAKVIGHDVPTDDSADLHRAYDPQLDGLRVMKGTRTDYARHQGELSCRDGRGRRGAAQQGEATWGPLSGDRLEGVAGSSSIGN
jgi:hypothetical protein